MLATISVDNPEHHRKPPAGSFTPGASGKKLIDYFSQIQPAHMVNIKPAGVSTLISGQIINGVRVDHVEKVLEETPKLRERYNRIGSAYMDNFKKLGYESDNRLREAKKMPIGSAAAASRSPSRNQGEPAGTFTPRKVSQRKLVDFKQVNSTRPDTPIMKPAGVSTMGEGNVVRTTKTDDVEKIIKQDSPEKPVGKKGSTYLLNYGVDGYEPRLKQKKSLSPIKIEAQKEISPPPQRYLNKVLSRLPGNQRRTTP